MNIRISQILSLIVMGVGIAVMLGWYFDITVLKSILPQWGSMKFITALCFFLTGIIILSMGVLSRRSSSLAQVFVYICSLLIALIMGGLILSLFLNIKMGIEELFVQEAPDSVFTTVAGRPSIFSMICFILIVTVGLFSIFSSISGRSVNLLLRIISSILWGVGLVAIMGYVLNQPLLYYSIVNVSTAMSLHAAILFCLSGISLLVLSLEK